jgi:hypothetical protein
VVALPTRYYVQTSQTDSTFGPPQGWRTIIVTLDRSIAERYAVSFERSVLFEDGEDVSELVATVARVMTEHELRDVSDEALAQAEIETRVQFQQIVEAWKETLDDPAHE